MANELCFKSAAELADDIRTGAVSPVTVVDARLDRIAERDAARRDPERTHRSTNDRRGH